MLGGHSHNRFECGRKLALIFISRHTSNLPMLKVGSETNISAAASMRFVLTKVPMEVRQSDLKLF